MENSDIVKVFVQSPREELRPFIKRFLVAGFSSARQDSHLTDTDVGNVSNAVRKNNWHSVGLGSSPLGWRGRTLIRKIDSSFCSSNLPLSITNSTWRPKGKLDIS